jgi:selenoprotein W-related protein
MVTELFNRFGEEIEAITVGPGEVGSFEVFLNGELIFSKKATGRFPEWRELRELIEAKRSGTPAG